MTFGAPTEEGLVTRIERKIRTSAVAGQNREIGIDALTNGSHKTLARYLPCGEAPAPHGTPIRNKVESDRVRPWGGGPTGLRPKRCFDRVQSPVPGVLRRGIGGTPPVIGL